MRSDPLLLLAGLSGCCPNNGDASSENPHGIWLSESTLAAFGGRVQPGLPRQAVVVGSGASLGDVDGDGDVDVVLARVSNAEVATGGPSEFFRNGGGLGQLFLAADASFRDLTINHIAYGSALADYDADGDLDVFLACAGEDLLLENRGDGTFRNVTGHAGVAGSDGDLSTSAVFADLNNDGLLDLYVSDYVERKRLYINLGDKTFLDASVLSGANAEGKAHTAAVADFDNDARLDIYLPEDTLAFDDMPPQVPNVPRDALFVEAEIDDTGVPHYLEKAGQYGLQKNRSSRGLGLADFNDDGYLDVYVTDSGANEMYLWRNDIAVYEEVSRAMNTEVRQVGEGMMRTTSINWGALPIDLDRDGALELYVSNGTFMFMSGPDASRYQQVDHLLRQKKPGGAFLDVTASTGLATVAQVGEEGELLNGRGVYSGDLDGDGDDDLVLGAFNQPFRVFMNDTPRDQQGHYVRLRLRGTVSAPDPIGAIVNVTCTDGRVRTGWRTQGGHTYGTSDNVIELACGVATPKSVVVQWPSGLVQSLGEVVDRELLVEEPRWLELSARVVRERDDAPVLTYLPVDIESGKQVEIFRSDTLPVAVSEVGEATYVATLEHPGHARRTTLTIIVDGNILPISPMIDYR